MRRYQEAAFRAAVLVLRDAAEAEDATQEAFVKAYRALRTFDPNRGAFRPWLLRIAVNQALSMAKSRSRRAAATERAAVLEPRGPTGLPQSFSVDETVMGRERARLIWSALQSLPERERVVVYLRYFLSLPERELAEYMGCAPGTVKSRLHRALMRLREVVQRQYPQLLGDMA